MTNRDLESAFRAGVESDANAVDSDYLITDDDYGDPFEGL